MSKNGSLTYQVNKRLSDMFAFGESKHRLKISGDAVTGIFSFQTAKVYIRECCAFTAWVKQRHPDVKRLDDCRKYYGEYIRSVRKQDGSVYSPYSLATKAAAIAKLFGCHKLKTPVRSRSAITRSRNTETQNRSVIELFCDGTGLRRCELERIRGTQLYQPGNGAFIRIIGNQAKGGKPRLVPVISNRDLIVDLMTRAGDHLVFGKITHDMDVHAHRARYASTLYKMYARPLEVCKAERFYNKSRGVWNRDSVYHCRSELAGTWFDKRAMLIVSRALGHNRISVIAEHYLYRL